MPIRARSPGGSHRSSDQMTARGLGFGFFQSPNNRVIIASAPRERSGGAAGLQSSGRLIGQSFGTALAAVALGRAPAHATEIALWGAAALTLAGALASGLRRSD